MIVCPSTILAGILLHALISGISKASGLKDVRLTAPVAVRRGSRVKLSCDYDLEDAQLYSVKWYRGDQEFFRFVPNDEPRTQVFPYHGVSVDVSLSGARGVVLRDVEPELTGVFKCEVSADAPLFHTIIREAAMVIVDAPDDTPLIVTEDGRLQFVSGETLRANCSSPLSFPAANLTWFINGRQVAESYVRQYPVMNSEGVVSREERPQPPGGGADTGGNQGVGEKEGGGEEGGAVRRVGDEEAVRSGKEANAQGDPVPEGAVTKETSVVGLEIWLGNSTLTSFPFSSLPSPPSARGEVSDKSELPHPGATLLRLRCLATLFTLYRRTTEVELVVLPSSPADEFSPKIASVLHEEAQQSNQSSGLCKTWTYLLPAVIACGLLFLQEAYGGRPCSFQREAQSTFLNEFGGQLLVLIKQKQ